MHYLSNPPKYRIAHSIVKVGDYIKCSTTIIIRAFIAKRYFYICVMRIDIYSVHLSLESDQHPLLCYETLWNFKIGAHF